MSYTPIDISLSHSSSNQRINRFPYSVGPSPLSLPEGQYFLNYDRAISELTANGITQDPNINTDNNLNPPATQEPSNQPNITKSYQLPTFCSHITHDLTQETDLVKHSFTADSYCSLRHTLPDQLTTNRIKSKQIYHMKKNLELSNGQSFLVKKANQSFDKYTYMSQGRGKDFNQAQAASNSLIPFIPSNNRHRKQYYEDSFDDINFVYPYSGPGHDQIEFCTTLRGNVKNIKFKKKKDYFIDGVDSSGTTSLADSEQGSQLDPQQQQKQSHHHHHHKKHSHDRKKFNGKLEPLSVTQTITPHFHMSGKEKNLLSTDYMTLIENVHLEFPEKYQKDRKQQPPQLPQTIQPQQSAGAGQQLRLDIPNDGNDTETEKIVNESNVINKTKKVVKNDTIPIQPMNKLDYIDTEYFNKTLRKWCKEIQALLVDDWANLRIIIKFLNVAQLFIQFDLTPTSSAAAAFIPSETMLIKYMTNFIMHGLGSKLGFVRSIDKWGIVETIVINDHFRNPATSPAPVTPIDPSMTASLQSFPPSPLGGATTMPSSSYSSSVAMLKEEANNVRKLLTFVLVPPWFSNNTQLRQITEQMSRMQRKHVALQAQKLLDEYVKLLKKSDATDSTVLNSNMLSTFSTVTQTMTTDSNDVHPSIPRSFSDSSIN